MEVQEPGIRHAIGVEKHSRDPPPLLLAPFFSKSSLQQSPLGEARLQGLRAELWLKLVGLDIIKSGSHGWGTGTPKPRSIAP